MDDGEPYRKTPELAFQSRDEFKEDTMRNTFPRVVVMASLTGFLMMSSAGAQTTQEHTAHHPDTPATTSPAQAAPSPGSNAPNMAQVPPQQGMNSAQGMSQGGMGSMGSSEGMMPMMMQMMRQGGMQGMPPGGGMGRGMGMMDRLSPEDRSAFVDAHIAALHAGLKLSADQEKLWPPVEDAIRSLARLHLSHMDEMQQRRGAMMGDPIGMLRRMAEHMGQGADAARKLADAAAPLYGTLDESQRRRLRVLAAMGPGAMGHGGTRSRGIGMTRPWSGDIDDDEQH